jgi:hypothetical protein
MSNIEVVNRVAYEERIHRELHGTEHAVPYLKALRIAAKTCHVEGIFDDVTFNEHGLAIGGPFTNPAVERV